MIGYSNELISVGVDGTALSNSVVLTSILPANVVPAGNNTFTANFFNYLGQEIILEAGGRISTLGAGPGTLSFAFQFGATSVGVSPAFALAAGAVNVSWWLRWIFNLRVTGGAAKFLSMGYWASAALSGSAAGTAGMAMIPTSAPAVGNAFNAGVAQTSDLKAQFSVADPANSIQLHQFRVISPN